MTPAGGNPPDSKPITMTYSMAETVDDEKFKSMVEVLQGSAGFDPLIL